MGQTLLYYGFILSLSKQTAPRGMVSVAKGHQTRLSACTVVVHIGSQHPGYLHDETMLLGLYLKISDGGDPEGNTASSLRRRHNVRHPGLQDCSSHPSSMIDIFSDFSGLQLNRAKSIFMGFGLPTKEASRCVEHLATPIMMLPIQYMGLPLANKRLRLQD